MWWECDRDSSLGAGRSAEELVYCGGGFFFFFFWCLLSWLHPWPSLDLVSLNVLVEKDGWLKLIHSGEFSKGIVYKSVGRILGNEQGSIQCQISRKARETSQCRLLEKEGLGAHRGWLGGKGADWSCPLQQGSTISSQWCGRGNRAINTLAPLFSGLRMYSSGKPNRKLEGKGDFWRPPALVIAQGTARGWKAGHVKAKKKHPVSLSLQFPLQCQAWISWGSSGVWRGHHRDSRHIWVALTLADHMIT